MQSAVGSVGFDETWRGLGTFRILINTRLSSVCFHLSSGWKYNMADNLGFPLNRFFLSSAKIHKNISPQGIRIEALQGITDDGAHRAAMR